MSIQELNQDQLIELYHFWLIDLVREIHTKIMNSDEFSEIPKFVERVWQNGDF